MNKAQILELLARPGLISSVNTAELESMVKMYPYFSVGQILLSKKYDQQKDLRAIHQLNIASLAANDRIRLKDFMTETDSPVSASSETIQAKMVVGIDVDSSNEVGALNEIAGAGAEYIPTPYLESENEADEFVIEHDAEMDSMNTIEEEFVLHDLEIESNEIEIVKASEVEATKEIEEESDALVDDEDLSAAEIISEQFIDENVSRIELHQESIFEPVVQDFLINEKVASPGEFLPEKSHSFTGWLKFFSMDKMKGEFPVNTRKEVEEENKTPEQIRKSDDGFFNHNMENELQAIDKIVSSIKTISSPKEVSAENLAKRSLELSEEIISETLANIYEDQALYEKAIRMYVKLSLKYPSKVSLFAARIKELKNKK